MPWRFIIPSLRLDKDITRSQQRCLAGLLDRAALDDEALALEVLLALLPEDRDLQGVLARVHRDELVQEPRRAHNLGCWISKFPDFPWQETLGNHEIP